MGYCVYEFFHDQAMTISGYGRSVELGKAPVSTNLRATRQETNHPEISAHLEIFIVISFILKILASKL